MTCKEILNLANQLLQKGRFIEAIPLYEASFQLNPNLSNFYKFNLDFCNRKIDSLYVYDSLPSLGIEPVSQLMKRDGHNEWTSIGEDPFFFLDPSENKAYSSGWYILRIVVKTPYEENSAKLYFDYGDDFNEADSLDVSYKSNALAYRVIRLKKPVTKIRFDPMETSGDFSILSLTFDSISNLTAKSLMLARLLSVYDDVTSDEYCEDILSENKNSIFDLLDLILDRYNLSYIEQQSVSYKKWIEFVEGQSLPAKNEVGEALNCMRTKPLISVVMPVYNPPAEYLRSCIDSVVNQSYPNWEFCIADDNSSSSHVKEILKEYEAKDSRIRVIFREKNGHISRATNSALEIARGDFVALLDHDDLLPEHALYYVAEAINKNPDAQIIYSDEDKIDKFGNRFEPHFKSDWNPDLFFSQNYISHLGVYRRDLIQRVNGFRVGVEGSQDYDLLLRCLPHTDAVNIIHIPKILYHWRALEGSTALNSGEKSYTTVAGITALSDYFKQTGQNDVEVEGGLIPNTYRIRWPIPKLAPLVSLLIPTRDRKDITEVAVRSILEKTAYLNFEIIIIDNGSVELQTLEWFEEIQKDSRVRIVRYDKPFNYSAINNFGEKFANGTILGLVNNDVEVISPEWMNEMVSHALRPEIGCVGAKLYFHNDTIQHAGVILGIGGVAGHSHKYCQRNDYGYFSRLHLTQALSAVTAACLFVRREVFVKVGGLDEINLSVAFNDVDFCLKVRDAGYRNLWTPFAELYHYESISRGAEDNPEKISRFQREVSYMLKKWGSELKIDPFYNPNLTNIKEDFSINGSDL